MHPFLNRRSFLSQTATGLSGIALAQLLGMDRLLGAGAPIRPDINPAAPELPVNLHLVGNQCTVSIDLAGDGLHRRGYRQERTVAPLRETLAAGVLLLSGWDGETPLVDPQVTSRPPRRRQSMEPAQVSLPTCSKTTSTPRFLVILRTAPSNRSVR